MSLLLSIIRFNKIIFSVSNTGLQLFTGGPFLEKKLGRDMFNKIPESPGIYRFYDSADKLLYTGKAKNLRKRLFTYKRASAGKTTRKEAALIGRINRFEYDVFDCEEEAILAENRWIRGQRPEFNHQNKHIETYYYIILYKTNRGIGLEYKMNPSVPLYKNEPKERRLEELKNLGFTIISAKLFGCFKGHRQVRTHLGNILRLIWLVLNSNPNPFCLPPQLSRNLTPKRYFYDLTTCQKTFSCDLQEGLTNWFNGRSPELVYQLAQHLPSCATGFQQRYFCSVTDQLFSYFYRTLLYYGNIIRMRKKTVNRVSFIKMSLMI